MRTDDLPERLPPHAGVQTPVAHISVHAVLVRGDSAHFDDLALRGVSDVESGVEWVAAPDELPDDAQHWRLVWIAVTHGDDGTRAYTGAVAETLRLDALHRKGYRTEQERAGRVDRAIHGDADVRELEPEERRALRTALVHQDPEAWDHASRAMIAALGGEAERNQ